MKPVPCRLARALFAFVAVASLCAVSGDEGHSDRSRALSSLRGLAPPVAAKALENEAESQIIQFEEEAAHEDEVDAVSEGGVDQGNVDDEADAKALDARITHLLAENGDDAQDRSKAMVKVKSVFRAQKNKVDPKVLEAEIDRLSHNAKDLRSEIAHIASQEMSDCGEKDWQKPRLVTATSASVKPAGAEAPEAEATEAQLTHDLFSAHSVMAAKIKVDPKVLEAEVDHLADSAKDLRSKIAHLRLKAAVGKTKVVTAAGASAEAKGKDIAEKDKVVELPSASSKVVAQKAKVVTAASLSAETKGKDSAGKAQAEDEGGEEIEDSGSEGQGEVEGEVEDEHHSGEEVAAAPPPPPAKDEADGEEGEEVALLPPPLPVEDEADANAVEVHTASSSAAEQTAEVMAALGASAEDEDVAPPPAPPAEDEAGGEEVALPPPPSPAEDEEGLPEPEEPLMFYQEGLEDE